jgi:hypothetical protein
MGGVFGGGGGGKKGGAPKAPDFTGLAQQQSVASRPNTANPLGGQTWSIGPDGRPVSSTQFSGQAGQTFGNLLGGMNEASQVDPTQAGNEAFNRVYGAYQSRLDPMWQARQTGFNSQMANSGLLPGSAAYDNAARTFGNQRNDAYNQAIGQSVGLGQSEQAQARANAMQPFQQAGGLLSMLNNQAPNYGQAPNLLGAGSQQYNAAMNSQEAQNSKKGSALGGLGNIAGTLFGGPAGGLLGGGRQAQPGSMGTPYDAYTGYT